MSTTNPKVDAFLIRAKTWREEMARLRSILLACGLTEELKWGKPCYMYEGANLVILAPFKETCAMILAKGALLKDPKRLLFRPSENTQGARQWRFTSLQQIEKLASTISAYMREAIAAEKAGLEVTYKKPSEHPLPEELQKKLKADATFKKAFQALTPGRQRAYALFFSAPKQSSTRESRIEKCTPRILAGQGPHDEYRQSKKT